MAGHILQSAKWGEFRKKTPNVKKVFWIGGCQIFIHRIPHLPWTVAYLPRPEKLDNLEEIKEACRREKAIFLKIEPLKDPSTKLGISAKPVLPQHTIYLDLTKSEGELLAAMHEKTRYNIHLAQKKGVVVKNEDTLKAIENFTRLLSETESRQGFYSHYPKYYQLLWQTLRPAKMVYLLSAYVPDRPNVPVAAIMLFHYQDFLYYPYGGSDPNFRDYMAPNLLHWEAIKLGQKLGAKVYDLWGSFKERPEESDPWWGIYRFKRGFGGKEVTFPETVDFPLSPLYFFYPLADKLRWLFKK